MHVIDFAHIASWSQFVLDKEWLKESAKVKQAQDELAYILHDKKAEEAGGFELAKSLADNTKVLQGYAGKSTRLRHAPSHGADERSE